MGGGSCCCSALQLLLLLSSSGSFPALLLCPRAGCEHPSLLIPSFLPTRRTLTPSSYRCLPPASRSCLRLTSAGRFCQKRSQRSKDLFLSVSSFHPRAFPSKTSSVCRRLCLEAAALQGSPAVSMEHISYPRCQSSLQAAQPGLSVPRSQTSTAPSLPAGCYWGWSIRALLGPFPSPHRLGLSPGGPTALPLFGRPTGL